MAESLKKETPEERSHMNSLLLPFVILPIRYPSTEVPTNYFHLPFSPSLHTLPTTIQTVHNPYPVWPPPYRTTVEVHYNSRPIFNIPLIAPAAKLLFFARQELIPLESPAHLADNRAEWLARGNMGIGVTREDIDEFNWGWSVRPPRGQGPTTRKSREGGMMWSWGIGNANPLGSFLEDDSEAEGRNLPASTASNSRWAGKAPLMTLSSGTTTKSTRWDSDWWRLRLCGGPSMPRPRVPYGNVYEPGCMDGFWHGRMLVC